MKVLHILAYPFGLGVVIATLVGANQLTNTPKDPGAGAGGAAKAAAAAKSTEGVVQKGIVATETGDLWACGLPAHLPSGRLIELKVRDGQVVKAGELLARFDDWAQQADLQKAQATLAALQSQLADAAITKSQHDLTLQQARLAVETATKQLARAREVAAAVKDRLQKAARVTNTPLDNLSEYPEYLKMEGLVEAAEAQVKEKQLQLEQALKINPELKYQALAYQAKAAEAEVVKAQQALERCRVVADVGGVVEKVSAYVGEVVYPQSRPLFYIVPEGPRLVKVEIVPEFAHKIRDREQSRVVISDDSNPLLTYEGTVERICSAFLPKTNALDLLSGKATNVLEVIVRVSDPTPAGKPPLRVGQPVRVAFP